MALSSGDPALIVLASDGNLVAGPVASPSSGDPVITVMGADGLPVAVTGGGGGVNPCLNNEPQMLVKVEGASGTINWCGQTWNLPADDGVVKSACPTQYFYENSNPFPGLYTSVHEWSYNSDLSLIRNYDVYYDASPGEWLISSISNQLVLISGTNSDAKHFTGAGSPTLPIPITGSYTTATALNMILSVGPATYTDYTITDDFFGSHTIGSIKYSWAKGAGW